METEKGRIAEGLGIRDEDRDSMWVVVEGVFGVEVAVETGSSATLFAA